jgi:hypothetical protein
MHAIKDIVKSLDFGTSTAECDGGLADYFLETNAFRKVISQSSDIISGDKGTGKSAIYKILREKHASYAELSKVIIVEAFDPSGDPVFRQLKNSSELDESKFRELWKNYIFAIAGIEIAKTPSGSNGEIQKIKSALIRNGLYDPKLSVGDILNKLFSKLKEISRIELQAGMNSAGVANLAAAADFSNAQKESAPSVLNEERVLPLLQMLDTVLKRKDQQLWIIFDRLDESFSDAPLIEVPALRALLRTYLDFSKFSNLRLKLFIRQDLFGRVTETNFVNLSHIITKQEVISWSPEDLWSMLSKRLLRSKSFKDYLDSTHPNKEPLVVLLPEKIDSGKQKPSTRNWVLNHIKDGNGVYPPRSLIDFFNLARDAQIKKDNLDSEGGERRGPVLEPASFKEAFKVLSRRRVEDTLYAEVSHLRRAIDAFRDGKSEHSDTTLAEICSKLAVDRETTTKQLLRVGFLERFGSNYKIPFIYRDFLRIKQGKA